MTDTYGMSFSQLKHIIDATDDSLAAMRQLDGQVQNFPAEMAQANQSDAGTTLSSNLITWTEDFGQIQYQLSQLNSDVTAIYNQAMSDQTDAAGAAQGGR